MSLKDFENNQEEQSKNKQLVLHNAETVVDDILSDISSGNYKNSYGEPESDYFAIVKDSASETSACIQVVLQTDGLGENERNYGVFLVDEINNNGETTSTEWYYTDSLDKNELIQTIKDIQQGVMYTFAERPMYKEKKQS